MIIGNKIIRVSRVSLIKIGSKVIKIPLSLFACKEMRQERQIISGVKKDEHFANYLLKYKYFFCFQFLPFLNLIDLFENKNLLIKNYFDLAFKNAASWPEKKIIYLLDYKYYLSFIKEHFFSDYTFFKDYLTKMKMPDSSAHGDFHSENILVKNNQLFFIDWIKYRHNSSRYFDLIDYYIFNSKDKNTSWMTNWREKYNNTNQIYGIEVKKDYFLGYAIWKTSEELKTLYLRKTLNEQKKQKYINFIKILKQVLQNG